MKILCRVFLMMFVILVVVILIGCGKKEEFVVVVFVVVLVVVVLVVDLLKVVFVYIGLVGDVGWIFVYDKGCKVVEEKFGDKVKIIFVENIFEFVVDVECVFC